MADALHLTLTADDIEKHCVELKAQSRSPAHLLSALVALQACITTHTPPGSQADPAFRDIQAVLENHAATARESLLEETATLLQTALLEQDRRAIMRAHAALSRNGFWQAVARAARQPGAGHFEQAANWLASWCEEMKARAQAASPYPDSLDFRAAGIDPKAYAAMDETRRALDAAGYA